MTLEQKIQRSRSTEEIDFSKYQPAENSDELVRIVDSDRLLAEPYWVLPDNWEGAYYQRYILEHPDYDGIFVRAELAQKLASAAASLDARYRLAVRAGHRPMEVQRQLLTDCAQTYKNEHPEATDEQALAHARIFVSDPGIELSPHVCGAAVDVELIDAATGQPLDFGSLINATNEKSFLYYPELTDVQQHNRQTLLVAMLTAGFASLASEWWHFSYGDQVWAWFYGEPESLYSLAEYSGWGAADRVR